MASEIPNSSVSDDLFKAVLNRMNITWAPDAKQARNIENAIEEARGYLTSVSGNSGVSFEGGELRGLLITCAWYFVENKRADFILEYRDELIGLRLREGFGCGKAESEV